MSSVTQLELISIINMHDMINLFGKLQIGPPLLLLYAEYHTMRRIL